jgi:hypothetical protein
VNAGKADLIGGVFAGILTPSTGKQNFWEQRAEATVTGVIAGGAAGGIGTTTGRLLEGVLGNADQAIGAAGRRATKVVVRGITNGITRSSIGAILGTQHMTAEAVSGKVSQSVVRGAVSEATQ